MQTLANPTRDRKSRSGGGAAKTVEERAWPDETQILAVMRCGFTYEEAWTMSPRDCRRYLAIERALSIPSDQRTGAVRIGRKGESVFG